MWAVDTHFGLSVYITEVMRRDQMSHLGILQCRKKKKISAKYLGDRRRKKQPERLKPAKYSNRGQ